MSAKSDISATWTAVFFLLLASGILLVGVGLFFTALGLRAGAEQFSTVATGLVMSSYFAGFVFGTMLCPALIRRAGHIRAFAAFASIASTTAIVHAIAIDPWVWSLLRMITGFCLVGLYMVMESWLNVLAPNAARGRVFSAYVAVTLVAMGIGQFLVLAGDVVGFVPLGLVSILLSLALVPVTFTRTPEPPPVKAPKISLQRLYAISPLGAMAALASGLLNSAFFGMGAVFGQRIGLTEIGVAAFMGITIFGGALLQWPVGHASDNHDRRRVLTIICVLAAGVAVLANALKSVSVTALIVCTFFYGGLVFTIYGLSVALINDRIPREEVLEAASTLLLVHGIGAVLGPLAAGLMMELYGPGGLLVYFALVLSAMALFALWRLRIGSPLPVEQQAAYVSIAASSPVVLEMDPRTPDAERPA
ncbi:MAG: MFS transporter [Burkholderiales bacterium]|nr:MFS transporter [Burkholderiales bacterium]